MNDKAMLYLPVFTEWPSYKMHKYLSRARVDAHADHTSMKIGLYTRVNRVTIVANFIFLLRLN